MILVRCSAACCGEVHQEDLDRAVSQNIPLMCSVYEGRSCAVRRLHSPCNHPPENPYYQECSKFQEARCKSTDFLAGRHAAIYLKSS